LTRREKQGHIDSIGDDHRARATHSAAGFFVSELEPREEVSFRRIRFAAFEISLTRRAKHRQSGIIEMSSFNPRGEIRRGIFRLDSRAYYESTVKCDQELKDVCKSAGLRRYGLETSRSFELN
jgi:hypothetical protein